MVELHEKEFHMRTLLFVLSVCLFGAWTIDLHIPDIAEEIHEHWDRQDRIDAGMGTRDDYRHEADWHSRWNSDRDDGGSSGPAPDHDRGND